MGQMLVSGNPATRQETAYGNIMKIIPREIGFERVAFPAGRTRTGAVRWIVILAGELHRRKSLYLSARELIRSIASNSWGKSTENVLNKFTRFEKQGLLVRSNRVSDKGKGNVIIWGLSGRGKALVRLYVEYMSGMHDDKLGL